LLDKKIEKEYWDRFYLSEELHSPSSFAIFCQQNFLKSSRYIIDLGCGTGRDSLYFHQQGHKILGVDQSSNIISILQQTYSQKFDTLRFTEGDFSTLGDIEKFDVVYSRFSLHSVDSVSASNTLRWAFRNLNENGLILIEARSVNDELYNKGQPAGKDAFILSHYRRFLRLEEIYDELQSIGFKINFIVEGKGFAKFHNEDPSVIRICAGVP